MNVEGPQSLIQMMQGAQVTGIFNAAVELGVCTHIAQGAHTAAAVAKAASCPERSTRILLDAMATLGLVTKKTDSYALTPVTEQFLVRGKPTYMGDLTSVFAGSSSRCGRARRSSRTPCAMAAR